MVKKKNEVSILTALESSGEADSNQISAMCSFKPIEAVQPYETTEKGRWPSLKGAGSDTSIEAPTQLRA